MIISPQTFISENEEKTYKELLTVRDELLEEVCAFEAEPYDPAKDLIDPPADFVYLMNLEYLEKLFPLIAEKYRQEFFRKEEE